MLSLLQPNDGSLGVSISPNFTWATTDGATSFRLQVATTADFVSPVIDILTNDMFFNCFANGIQLAPVTIYFWRVGQSIDEISYTLPRIFVSSLATPVITSAINDPTAVAGGSAIINWNISSVNGITGFVVAHSGIESGRENEINCNVTDRTIKITGLPNKATRYFAVKAVGSAALNSTQQWDAGEFDAIITEDEEPVIVKSSDYVIR